tara:strand:- start:40299 stop:40502 length:204 start_codon:yes stop_codon:yes gene_type:complete
MLKTIGEVKKIVRKRDLYVRIHIESLGYSVAVTKKTILEALGSQDRNRNLNIRETENLLLIDSRWAE